MHGVSGGGGRANLSSLEEALIRFLEMEHGEARIPEGTLRIDCLLPVEDQVTQLFATDWFAPLDPPKEEEVQDLREL